MAHKIAIDYCNCYETFSKIYMDNDTLMYDTCINVLSDKYEYIYIRNRILDNPQLPGNEYRYTLLDSIGKVMFEVEEYLKNECPEAAAFPL